MKPTKNRIYCISANRQKMLFESKKKADNCIAFNAEEIMKQSGKAPVRSYYCRFCGGWHITSNPSTEIGERLDYKDNIIMRRVETVSVSKMARKEYTSVLDKVNSLIAKGMLEEAEDKVRYLSYNVETDERLSGLDRVELMGKVNKCGRKIEVQKVAADDKKVA